MHGHHRHKPHREPRNRLQDSAPRTPACRLRAFALFLEPDAGLRQQRQHQQQGAQRQHAHHLGHHGGIRGGIADHLARCDDLCHFVQRGAGVDAKRALADGQVPVLRGQLEQIGIQQHAGRAE